jgi:hypothetical protein
MGEQDKYACDGALVKMAAYGHDQRVGRHDGLLRMPGLRGRRPGKVRENGGKIMKDKFPPSGRTASSRSETTTEGQHDRPALDEVVAKT